MYNPLERMMEDDSFERMIKDDDSFLSFMRRELAIAKRDENLVAMSRCDFSAEKGKHEFESLCYKYLPEKIANNICSNILYRTLIYKDLDKDEIKLLNDILIKLMVLDCDNRGIDLSENISLMKNYVVTSRLAVQTTGQCNIL